MSSADKKKLEENALEELTDLVDRDTLERVVREYLGEDSAPQPKQVEVSVKAIQFSGKGFRDGVYKDMDLDISWDPQERKYLLCSYAMENAVSMVTRKTYRTMHVVDIYELHDGDWIVELPKPYADDCTTHVVIRDNEFKKQYMATEVK